MIPEGISGCRQLFNKVSSFIGCPQKASTNFRQENSPDQLIPEFIILSNYICFFSVAIQTVDEIMYKMSKDDVYRMFTNSKY